MVISEQIYSRISVKRGPASHIIEHKETTSNWQTYYFIVLRHMCMVLFATCENLSANQMTKPHLLTEINSDRVWITNTSAFLWDVVTHPCHDVNSRLTEPELKLYHAWVITPTICYVDVIIYPHTNKRGHLVNIFANITITIILMSNDIYIHPINIDFLKESNIYAIYPQHFVDTIDHRCASISLISRSWLTCQCIIVTSDDVSTL